MCSEFLFYIILYQNQCSNFTSEFERTMYILTYTKRNFIIECVMDFKLKRNQRNHLIRFVIKLLKTLRNNYEFDYD